MARDAGRWRVAITLLLVAAGAAASPWGCKASDGSRACREMPARASLASERLRGGKLEVAPDASAPALAATASPTRRKPGADRGTSRGSGRGSRLAARRGGRPSRGRPVRHAAEASPAAAHDTTAEADPVATPSSTAPAGDDRADCISLRELIEWREPVHTMALLAGGSTFFAAVLFGPWSAASLIGAGIFYYLLISNGATLLWRLAHKTFGERPLLSVLASSVREAMPTALRPGALHLELDRALHATAVELPLPHQPVQRRGNDPPLTHSLRADATLEPAAPVDAAADALYTLTA